MNRFILMAAFLIAMPLAAQPNHYYHTDFPATENPISQGSIWLNGGTNGTAWNNCETSGSTPGLAYGTTVNNQSTYNDNICVLKGTWNASQMAVGVVHTTGTSFGSSTQAEVELHLNQTITTNNSTGYEFDASVLGSNVYLDIVKWLGQTSLGPGVGFCYFTPGTSTCSATPTNVNVLVHDGDIIIARSVHTGSSTTLYMYVNGALEITATDNSPYTNGAPGMGMWNILGTTTDLSHYGFKSFTAYDDTSAPWMDILVPTRAIDWSQAGDPNIPSSPAIYQTLGTPSFGTVNAWVPMTGQTIGAAITTTNLGAGTLPNGNCTWSVNGSGTQKVAASQGTTGGSVTVGSTQYAASTATQSISFDNGTNFTYDACSMSSTSPIWTYGFYETFGPVNAGSSGNLYDTFRIDTLSGTYAVAPQLHNGNGGSGANQYCANIEVGTPVNHSSQCIVLTPGGRYWVTGLVDTTNGLAEMSIYNPATTPFTLVGTASVVINTGSNPFRMNFGNEEVGTSSGTTSYFQNFMITTSNVFPLLPTRTATTPQPVTAAQINSAISSCPAGEEVYLSPGIYNLSSSVDLQGTQCILGGAGADQTRLEFSGTGTCNSTGPASICLGSSDNNFKASPSNGPVVLSGTFNFGTDSLTFASVPNLKVGDPIILDQCDSGLSGTTCNTGTVTDNGGILVTDSTTTGTAISPGITGPYSIQGNAGGAQIEGRQQEQIVIVTGCNGATSIGTSCSGTNTTVQFWPPLYQQNWSSGSNPTAWWATNPGLNEGVLNLTVDNTNNAGSGTTIGVEMFNCALCWVKGIRSLWAGRAHVQLTYSTRDTVRDSYFFGTQLWGTSSYGTEAYSASDLLNENNIYHAIASPYMFNGDCSGCVEGYNFNINNFYGNPADGGSANYSQNAQGDHTSGLDNMLVEGNDGNQTFADVIHGTHNLKSVFRNYYAGPQSVCWSSSTNTSTGPLSFSTATWGSCTNGLIPLVVESFSRFYNAVGNILGTTGVNTVYNTGTGQNRVIGYGGNGSVPTDPNTAATILLWGNCDSATGFGSCRFNSGEVPSSLTGTQGAFSNPVPANNNLPSSFYYQSQPSWWPSGKAWPPTGPDVTSGNVSGVGGHVTTNPAQDCYKNVMGGDVNGEDNYLSFNANTCYYSATPTLTLTATHLTMLQGQPVPPLIWTWSTPSLASVCTGEPSLSTTATSSSTPGTYSISITAGTLSCTGYTLAFTGDSLVVIANAGIGAQLTSSVTYPTGFLSGPTPASLPQAINVTSNATCNLDSTGATDGTTCFNTLAARFMNTNCSTQPNYVTWLYFPPGTYTLAGPILPCGNGWHILGSGTGQTILRIPPNTSTYNTGTDAPWFSISSVSGNDNFREFLENLTIDIGYGNPNIQAIVLAMNNVGAVRNVVVYSEDSTADEMVFFHSYPGPALFKNVGIYGGNYALSSSQIEYSWTFDQFTTEGQLTTVLAPGSTKLNIQHWLSDNSVPALSVTNNGGIALLDSQFLNGSGTAITNTATSSVYIRNLSETGYSITNADSGTGSTVNYTGNITEKWTGTAQSLFNSGTSPASLNLPQAETPTPSDPSPSTWQALSTSINNWGTEIGSPTSATIYAAPGQYTGTSGNVNITVPDTVNHIQFYGALDTSQQPKLLITVAGVSTTPLIIDGCIYSVCTLIHTGSRTVVIRDTYLNTYQPSSGAGNVFFEDVSPYSGSNTTYFTQFQPGQSVWGRQFDPESRTGPEMQCSQCLLWILGLKTENTPDTDPVLESTNGGKSEIFGAFIYPLATSAGSTAPYYLTGSSAWIAPTFEYVNVNGYGWQWWVQETQSSSTLHLSTPSQNAGNYFLNAYYSYGAPASSGSLFSGKSVIYGSSVMH